MNNKIAVFAGTFSPFTMGHYDIVLRASNFFDKIYVCVAEDASGKSNYLSSSLRAEIAKQSIADIKNVEVKTFSGLLTNYMRKIDANVLIRGIRSGSDFEHEKSLLNVYKTQNPEIETFYLISSQNSTHISSTIVRELCVLGGNLDGFIHKNAEDLIKKCYSEQK